MHCLNCLDVEVPVVLRWFVVFLLELVHGILGEFFIVQFSVCFGPCKFSGVVFGFEVSVAFGSAESEGFAVVSDEHDSVSWVDGTGTEITPLNPHQQRL